ncbi:MAG: hypothetical protein ACN6N7_09635 [Chryseobacterium culicis]
MKKKLLFVMAFCCFAAKGQNIQHTYLDAVKLAKMYAIQDTKRVENRDDYTSILARYGIKENTENLILQQHQISTVLRVPPIVNANVIKGTNVSGTTEKYYDKENVKDLASSEIAGLSWQSAVINGTATFMAERFKAEMTNTVLQRMFDNIQDEEKNIAVLFPKTLIEIKRYYPKENVNSYYSSDLSFLQQVIMTDLNNLPENIVKSDDLLKNIPPKSRDFLVLGFQLMKLTKEEYPITDIIEKASKADYNDESVKKITSLCYLFSEALRDSKESTTKWINPIEDLKYTSEKTMDVKDLTAIFFYALMYEQLKPYNIALPGNPSNFSSNIQNILSNFNSFNTAYQLVKDKKFEKGDVDDYISYTTQIINTFKDFSQNPIIKQKYSINIENIEFIEKSFTIYKLIAKEEYKKVIPIVFVEIGNYFPDTINLQKMRPINFLAQMGTAETSKDVENILDSFALPIGSASIKRASNFNVSINGYVGLTTGLETAYADFGNETKWNIGLAAPIGISASMKNFTLFASVIDLGTMVNVRLGGKTNDYSGLKFEHFLSPGLGLYYNISKSPISFGLHYSYVPNLRNIKYEENYTTTVTETNSSVSRINFSILIDIPLLTIYNQ